MWCCGAQMDVLYYDLFPNKALEEFFDEVRIASQNRGDQGHLVLGQRIASQIRGD